jgi:hypothetical protein
MVRVLLPAVLVSAKPLLSQESPLPQSAPPRGSATFRLSGTSADSLLRLDHQFILSGSDTLILVPDTLLIRGKDYSINYRQGVVRFDSAFIARTTGGGALRTRQIRVRYTYLPFRFQESYYHRKMVVLKDTTRGDSLRFARPVSTFTVEDIFGTNLQKSGSLVRGFTVGTTRDLTPTSGLRMQLSGKIAADVEITAALSDENTPIQPEGTTQTLQEIDKVFVEIRSPVIGATLGDFNLELTGTEFGRLSRKLTGARGTADFRTDPASGSVTIAGAVSRGKYTTNQFLGSDGVQGPYRLSGQNSERPIIAIAGTERVYINGELQVRGEVNDYIIDYSTAEITFRPRRLITAASRIVVDFEYTDRQYSRSLFAGKVGSAFFSEKAKLSVSYYREGDDPDRTIDFTLSDSARSVLDQAGGDRNKAVISGVTQVDSNGQYMRVDTLVNAVPVQFYRYAPGNPNAIYRIVFSYVGTGQGEYVREQAGLFAWKGASGGDYLPIVYLPIPQLHQVFDATLEATPVEGLRLLGEFAASKFDANRLSTLPESKQDGQAVNFVGSYGTKGIRIGDLKLGDLDLALKERYTQANFVPIDRINDIEFNRKWGIDTVRQGDEEIREGLLKYSPSAGVSAGGGYGSYRKGSFMTSSRVDGTLHLRTPDLPGLEYFIENVRSRDESANTESAWLRQRGNASYGFWYLVPFVRYEGENRALTGITSGSVLPGSIRYNDVSAGASSRDLGKVSLTAAYGWRDDASVKNGTLQNEARSYTQTYAARLTDWQNLSTSFDITLRDKRYSQNFLSAGSSDIQTVLVRSQTRYTPLKRGVEADLYYEVSTEQTSRLQRLFVPVTPGTGNYKYLGDLNSNGKADEFEFEQVRFDGNFLLQTFSSDQLFPVIEVNTSFRLRLTPSRFLTGSGFWQTLFSPLTTDSYIRIQERSTERDLQNIYLLHLSYFQQDSTTINGYNIFTQDLNLFESDPAFSLRLRYSGRTGMSNFVTGIERGYGRERSVRIRFVPLREIANQLDYVEKIDRLTGQYVSNRFRDVKSDVLTYDFSYRPEQKFELGLKLDLGESTDSYPDLPLSASVNQQSVRAIYAFEGAGQARAEFSREETKLSRPTQIYSYELTAGRLPGLTWLWRITLDFRFVGFLQAGASYDGHIEGGGTPVHTLSAQVRAYF